MVDSEAKVALVTGSSSGIGEATVKLLSTKGYKVVVLGSGKEKVDEVAKACQDLSPEKFQPLALVLDFSDPVNGEVAVDRTVKHFGRLDVLVNNAGHFFMTTVERSAYENYRKGMAINIDASVKASLAAVEPLRKTKGTMVFISSVAATRPAELSYGYSMTKSAMNIFAKCLAIELAPAIRVNIVSPGPVKTSLFAGVGVTPQLFEPILNISTVQERVGRAEEIADAIAFLISEKAAFITGIELVVDGGYLLKPSPNDAFARLKQSL